MLLTMTILGALYCRVVEVGQGAMRLPHWYVPAVLAMNVHGSGDGSSNKQWEK
jgi:hypothetical protein